MRNQQLGNMAAKVEMVHIIHNALVLCVIDPGGVIHFMKLEVLESNSKLLFPGGVIYYAKFEVVESNSNILFLGGGGNLL